MIRKLRAQVLVFAAFGVALAAPFTANGAGDAPNDAFLPHAVGSNLIRGLEILTEGRQAASEADGAAFPGPSTQFRDISDPQAKKCAWQTFVALRDGLRRHSMPGSMPDGLKFDLAIDHRQSEPAARGEIVDNRALTEFSSGRIEGGISIIARWSIQGGELKCNNPTASDIGAFLGTLRLAEVDPRNTSRRNGRRPAGFGETPRFESMSGAADQ